MYCWGFCGAEAAEARLLAASFAFSDASFTVSLSRRWGVSPVSPQHPERGTRDRERMTNNEDHSVFLFSSLHTWDMQQYWLHQAQHDSLEYLEMVGKKHITARKQWRVGWRFLASLMDFNKLFLLKVDLTKILRLCLFFSVSQQTNKLETVLLFCRMYSVFCDAAGMWDSWSNYYCGCTKCCSNYFASVVPQHGKEGKISQTM